jgi:MobA/MobL family
MAIYHLAARVGSRVGGQSAAAAFAYLCRRGRYESGQRELAHIESRRLPGWAARDAGLYWRAADRYERANGRLYQQVKVGLPIELNEEQQVALAKGFAEALATTGDGALPYTLVVHRGQGRNPQAHVLLSERVADGHDRSAETWFRRAGSSPERSGARKTTAFQPKAWVGEVRARWAEHANRALEAAGSAARIDHRSHAARGLAQRPTVHEGPPGLRERQRGLPDDRAARNEEIRAANLRLGEIRTESATAQRQVEALARRLERERQEAGPSAEVLRFIELHRRDFRTRAEALRWFEQERGRLRVLPRQATARGLFEESLDEVERGRSQFSDALHSALVAPRWQEAPLSIGASIQQARVDVAAWTTKAAEVGLRLAAHRDPRSLWRRLWSADPERAGLERERDAALAQVELHRATLDRIEARWEEEEGAWEQRAEERNHARRERQREALERLAELRPEVLAELARRELRPERAAQRDPRDASYIRRRLRGGVPAEELWLDMLLLKPYTMTQQEELDRLIREIQAEIEADLRVAQA